MVQSPKFQIWLKIQLGQIATDDAWVANQMQPANLKIEHRENGKWVTDAGSAVDRS